MDILKKIGEIVGEAADVLQQKSRSAAYLSRLRSVVRCEEQAADREYLALGRYYYNSLRDKNNAVAEAHCAEIDAVNERLEKALDQLSRYYEMEQLSKSYRKDASGWDIIGGADIPEEGTVSEEETEEITLDDVECYDHDPTEEPVEAPGPAGSTPAPAEPEDNAGLPFEG